MARHYISEWAAGFNNIAAYDNRNVDNREVESIFPIDDPDLEALYAQCLSFLQEFEIEATERHRLCMQNTAARL